MIHPRFAERRKRGKPTLSVNSLSRTSNRSLGNVSYDTKEAGRHLTHEDGFLEFPKEGDFSR